MDYLSIVDLRSLPSDIAVYCNIPGYFGGDIELIRGIRHLTSLIRTNMESFVTIHNNFLAHVCNSKVSTFCSGNNVYIIKSLPGTTSVEYEIILRGAQEQAMVLNHMQAQIHSLVGIKSKIVADLVALHPNVAFTQDSYSEYLASKFGTATAAGKLHAVPYISSKL